MVTAHRFMTQVFKLGLSQLLTVVSLNGVALVLSNPAMADTPTAQATAVSRGSTPALLAQRTRSHRVIFRLSDRGVPVSRVGGAARGGCSTNSPHLQLTALTPITSAGKTALVDTVSPYPSFFVYLPETSAEEAEFILQDAQSQKDLYHESLTLTKTGGIVQVNLPQDKVAALAVNQQYRWSFTLICDPDDASANLFVEGMIQRVEAPADFTNQIKTATPVDRVPLYAAQGYWFEALQSLTQMRQQNPQDQIALQDWKDLLAAVKLDAIAQEPILINWAGKN